MKLNKHITCDPKIRFGKPCIRNTRIAVVDILNLLANGYSLGNIPKQYPQLTKREIVAAISFAAELAEEPTKIFVKSITQN